MPPTPLEPRGPQGLGARPHPKVPLVVVWLLSTWPVLRLLRPDPAFTQVDSLAVLLVAIGALAGWVVAPRHGLKLLASATGLLWIVLGMHDVPSYAALVLLLLVCWALATGWVGLPGREARPWPAVPTVLLTAATVTIVVHEVPRELLWHLDRAVFRWSEAVGQQRVPVAFGMLVVALATGVLGWGGLPRAGLARLRRAARSAADASDRWILGATRSLLAVVARWVRWCHSLAPTGPLPEATDRWSTPVGIWAAAQSAVLAVCLLVGDGWRSLTEHDTFVFTRIAEDGPSLAYGSEAPSVTSFPLYGLLIRWLEPLAGGFEEAAVVVAVAAGLGVTLVLWAWLPSVRIVGTTRTLATAAFAVYPYAFFVFGVAYSDGLFTMFAIGAFLLVERGRPVLAGTVAALATATRPTGLALIGGLVILQMERLGAFDGGRAAIWTARPVRSVTGWLGGSVRRVRASGLRPAHAGVLLAFVGVGAYSYYCWRAFGDPVAFWTEQRWYGHGTFLSPSTWGKEYFVTTIIDGRWEGMSPSRSAASTIHTLFMTGLTLGALAVLPAIRRAFGLGYAVYVLLVVVQTWVGATNMGAAGRYLIAAFPLHALAGVLAARWRPRSSVVLAASAAMWLLLLLAFVSTPGYPSW